MSKKVNSKKYNADIPQKRLTMIMSLQRQNDMISMLLDGKDSVKEITPYIVNKYGLKPNSIRTLLTEARGIIKQRRGYEVNNLVSLHINRYEELYKNLYEFGLHNIAMMALRAKEKLMGFHREGFHMKVTQGELTAVQLQTVDSDYDVLKLSKEKQDRLSILMSKARNDGGSNYSGKQIDGGSNKGL